MTSTRWQKAKRALSLSLWRSLTNKFTTGRLFSRGSVADACTLTGKEREEKVRKEKETKASETRKRERGVEKGARTKAQLAYFVCNCVLALLFFSFTLRSRAPDIYIVENEMNSKEV